MCGILNDPHEIARTLTIAAAPKIVVNQAGKSVEESNIELGMQMAVVYKTILRELSADDDVDGFIHSHEHDDAHSHEHSHADGLVHSHAHSHVHDHVH
ncbi:MAG: hypothetical protein LBU13_05420 [Synergistaceae bacterium]|jgi:hypothetical protein|nr:hypothetical protein [Synergistaceae bacterium]